MSKNVFRFIVLGIITLILGFSIQDKTPKEKSSDRIKNVSKAPIVTKLSSSFRASYDNVHDGVISFTFQDFESLTFPPSGWSLAGPDQVFWFRQNTSGYQIGTGAAEFNFYAAGPIPPDLTSSLVSPTVTATVAGDSLKFDYAYGTYIDEVDTLHVERSTDGGTSWILIETLLGGPDVGTGMVTVPPDFFEFVPSDASEWASKGYALPAGTNKVRFRCGSAYGNNLFVDNVAIGTNLANDVGTSSINVPPAINPGSITPQSSIKNFGTATNSFNVTMEISPSGYSSTQSVTSLAGGATTNVNFSNWSPPSLGLYNIKCYTSLAGDANTSNDTLYSTVNVTLGYWATGSTMPGERYLGTGVGYSRNDTGWAFVFGGINTSGLTQSSMFRYNMRTNVWDTRASLPLVKDRLGSARLKDSIYSIGGSTVDPDYTTDFYKYDINADTWVSRASLPMTLGWCKGIGYQDSIIYVAGGFDGDSALTQVLMYNSNTNTWRQATNLPAERFGGGFAISGDTLVYVSGVDGFSIMPDVYRGVINQTNRSMITWTSGAPMPGALSGGMFRNDAHSWGNKGIIVTGGSTVVSFGSVSGATLTYSPGANLWTFYPTKTTIWNSGLSGAAVSNNSMRLVGAGGYDGVNVVTATERFTDSTVKFSTEINIAMIQEGFLNTGTNTLNMRDTVRAYLRNTTAPYAIVDSAKGMIDSVSFLGGFHFTNATSGTYYIVLKHRNCLEVWSKSGGQPYVIGGKLEYNFTTAATQAYNSNLKLKGGKYTVFSGDLNNSGNVNLSDITAVFNAAATFSTGYVPGDLTGDKVVNLTDITTVFNNAALFATTQRP